MTSRARHMMAVLTTLGCLVGLGPLAASAQEEYKPATMKIAQADTKRPKAKKQASTPVEKVHKVAIQVSENSPQLMNQALNNANNIVAYYKKLGEKAVVEIVTFGDGLHMLRDSSPVKQRIEQSALETPEITYAACGNTKAKMSREENKEITLLSEAKITPSGVVRLAELQAQGYAYIRP